MIMPGTGGKGKVKPPKGIKKTKVKFKKR